jgi:hypothetical protein
LRGAIVASIAFGLSPPKTRKYLPGHEISTAYQQGWDKLLNGELLRAAELAGFDVLLTTDQNLGYQQNLAGRIAVVALGKNRRSLIQPEVDRIAQAVTGAAPGSYTMIEISNRVGK